MNAILFFKAHVLGYVRDGKMVRAYERKGLTSASARLGRVYAAAKHAEAGLSVQAQDAIVRWQQSNWDTGKLQRAFSGEFPKLAKEIRTAFAPVRAVLRKEFGETITLHRGQRETGEQSNPGRTLFSWTASPRDAIDFAHNVQYQYPVITDGQIAAAVDQYARTGYVKIGRKSYLRNKSSPEYYTIFGAGRQSITDGDDLEGDLRAMQSDAIAANADRAKIGAVHTAAVPIDQIAWIPGNLLSKEFIVARNPLAAP